MHKNRTQCLARPAKCSDLHASNNEANVFCQVATAWSFRFKVLAKVRSSALHHSAIGEGRTDCQLERCGKSTNHSELAMPILMLSCRPSGSGTLHTAVPCTQLLESITLLANHGAQAHGHTITNAYRQVPSECEDAQHWQAAWQSVAAAALRWSLKDPALEDYDFVGECLEVALSTGLGGGLVEEARKFVADLVPKGLPFIHSNLHCAIQCQRRTSAHWLCDYLCFA